MWKRLESTLTVAKWGMVNIRVARHDNLMARAEEW